MTKFFNEDLQKLRIAKNLDEGSAAKMFGMSIFEYYDLELYNNEWYMVVPFLTLKNVISYFDMRLSKYADLASGAPVGRDVSLNDFIRASRVQLGLSREEFADRVGFYAEFCEVIEGHPDGLFLWPFAVVEEVCSKYNWDAKDVIRKVLPSLQQDD